MKPKTSASHAAKLHEMNEESQTHILGSTSLCSTLEDAPKDAGTKFIMVIPSVTYLALGLLLLGILSLAVACGCLHCPSDAGLRFTVLESIIYGVAAVLCIRSMKKALCSRNLGLATGRLHGFVAEFKVNWSEVSGQEGCKYVSMWLLVVLIITVARGLGTYWRLSSSDSTDLTHEVLFGVLEMLSVLVFALTSGLLMSAAYTQSHLLLGLDKSLDCWCSHIMVMPDFEEGVRSWNVLQALLKCVGRELAGSFLVLQIFGSLCFIFFLVSGIMLAFRHLPNLHLVNGGGGKRGGAEFVFECVLSQDFRLRLAYLPGCTWQVMTLRRYLCWLRSSQVCLYFFFAH